MKFTSFVGIVISFLVLALFGALTYLAVYFRQIPYAALAFHLSLLGFTGFITLCCLEVLKPPRETRVNIGLSVGVVYVMFVLVEIVFRLQGTFTTQTERKSFGQYNSVRNREYLSSWFWTHQPHDTLEVIRPEFKFQRTTNSLGFSDKEFSEHKDRFRIIGIGDSFTEGSGVDADSTWLKHAERRLNLTVGPDKVEMLNAGIGGSDFVFGYMLLDSLLLQYQPDMVVLSINSSDYYDISFRGGFERFKSDGTCGIPPPKWEWLYMLSHVFRLVVHNLMDCSMDYLMPNKIHEENSLRFNAIANEAMKKYVSLSKKSGFDLLVVIHPIMQDFEKTKYSPPQFDFFVNSLDRMNVPHIDVKDCFEELGVTDQKAAYDYYWPLDTHFNNKGYKVYGECVADRIAPMIK